MNMYVGNLYKSKPSSLEILFNQLHFQIFLFKFCAISCRETSNILVKYVFIK